MNKHNVKNIIVSAVILAYLITTQGLVYNLQNTNRGLKNDLEDTQNENVQYKSELDKLNETIQEQNNKLNDLQKTADKYAKEQEETNKISDIITNSNSSVGSDTAHIIANAIISNSAKYNLPTEELMAVIRIESNFNQYELGTQQDSGLMQLIPSTQKLIAKDMGIIILLEDIMGM
jgi:soluble lytic murein transglycosylase-like protein